jgi:hypothetical protein
MKKLIIIMICALVDNSIMAQQVITETSVLYVIKKPNDTNEARTHNLIVDPHNILSLDVLSCDDSHAQYGVQKGTGVVKVTIKSSVQLINSVGLLKKYGISDKYYGLKIRVDGTLFDYDFLADGDEIKSVDVNIEENCIDVISKIGEKSVKEKKAKKGQTIYIR